MLAPFSTKVPTPFAVRLPEPAITPLTVRVVLVPASSVEPSPIRAMLRVAARLTLFGKTSSRPPARVRLVEALDGTAPREASLLMRTLPPTMNVPPL